MGSSPGPAIKAKSATLWVALLLLVRERGLEPPRRNHTHLKRACLPFQHSRNDALILYLLQMVLSIVFPKDTMWFSQNVPKLWTEGGSTA